MLQLTLTYLSFLSPPFENQIGSYRLSTHCGNCGLSQVFFVGTAVGVIHLPYLCAILERVTEERFYARRICSTFLTIACRLDRSDNHSNPGSSSHVQPTASLTTQVFRPMSTSYFFCIREKLLLPVSRPTLRSSASNL